MARVASGVTGASPIWNKIMSGLLTDAPSFDWPVPSGVKKVGICSLTGTLPCEGCSTVYEWFLEGTVPSKSCSLETIENLKKQNEEKNKQGNILEGAQTEVRP
jgi:penicillin-binding protein 1A